MSALQFQVSPQTQSGDLIAFLSSYSVELREDGAVWLRLPVFYLEMKGGIKLIPQPLPSPQSLKDIEPKIDGMLSLSLVRYIPTAEESVELRWPFWVAAPMDVGFAFGDQWWQFKFTPDKQYGERSL